MIVHHEELIVYWRKIAKRHYIIDDHQVAYFFGLVTLTVLLNVVINLHVHEKCITVAAASYPQPLSLTLMLGSSPLLTGTG